MRVLHLGSYLYGHNDIVNVMQRALHQLTKLQSVSIDLQLYAQKPSPFVERSGDINWVKDDVLLALVEEHRPKVIICNAGGISPTPYMHRHLEQLGIRRIGIALSDPDDFAPRSRHFAPLFNRYFTNSRSMLPRYLALSLTADYLPFAADADYHRPLDIPKLYDVVVVGEKRPDRVGLVQKMRERGLTIMCHGKGWEHPSTEVFGEDQIKAINSGIVYLSFAGTLAGHTNVKVGVFEAAACGSCVLVQDFPEIHQFFDAGRESVTFKSEDEAVSLALTLAKNPSYAARIGLAARERVLKEHTWQRRWLQVLDEEFNTETQQLENDEGNIMFQSQIQSSTSTNMKTALIAGYYGFENAGDEAILTSILVGLRKASPAISPIVVSGNPQSTRLTHQVGAVHYTDIGAIISAAQKSDLIILGGGGLFMDYWGVQVNSVLTRHHHGLAFYLAFPLLATLMKKPLMIYGVGAGPFFSKEAREFTRAAFEAADVATVRDEASRELIISTGVSPALVQLTADPAFLLKPAPNDQIQAIFDFEHIPYAEGTTVGVCLRWWDIGVDPERYWAQIAAALDRFIDKYDARIVFIPFQTLDEAGIKNDDRLIAEKVIERMQQKHKAFSLRRKYSAQEILGSVAQCDLIVGMRLHSLILAAAAHIPAISLIYDPKVRGLANQLNLQALSLDLSQVSTDSLFLRMENALNNRQQITHELTSKVAEITALAQKNVELSVSLIQNGKMKTASAVADSVRALIDESFLYQIGSLEAKEFQIETLQKQAHTLSDESSKLRDKLAEGIKQQDLLRDVHRQIAEIQNQKTTLQQENGELHNRVIERDMQLQQIYATKAWQAALSFWKTRDRVKRVLRSPGKLVKGTVRHVYHRVMPLSTRLKLRNLRYRILRRGVPHTPQFCNSGSSQSFSSVSTSAETNSSIVTTSGVPVSTTPFMTSKGKLLKPMSKQMDVFRFGVIPWDFRFQRPQQLMTQFAQDGHRIFYVHTELTDERAVAMRSIREDIFELRIPGDPTLILYRHPFEGSALKKAVQSLRAFIEAQHIQEALCIVDHPFWEPLVRFLKEEYGWKVIYDCMDDHSGFSDNQPDVLDYEVKLIELSDMLVVSSQLLFDKLHTQHSNTLLLRNAAEYEHFSALPPRENSPISHLSRPVIGYYGAIAEWFDVDVIHEAARRHPEWSFVLIGHTFGANLQTIEKLPNVHLLGEKPYQELPSYVAAFDVCVIPFKRLPLTEATNPVKIYEYLSAGKPIVARRLPELVALENLVYLYEDADSFVTGIEQMLDTTNLKVVQERQAIGRDNTWEIRYKALRDAALSLYGRASIVVVTFKNAEYTRLTIESILEKTTYPNYEIVVVDNGLEKTVIDLLAQLQKTQASKVKIVYNGRNLGFARANNIGIQFAEDSEYIVLLNDDVIVTQGWLSKLIRHLRDTGIGMVGPVTNSCGNEARIEVPYHNLNEIDDFAKRYTQAHQGDTFEIPMLAMYCVAMRKTVVDEIGDLDERFGIGMFEDDDYAQRLKQAGYKIICTRDVFVHHFGRASFSKLGDVNYFKIFEQNRRKYEQKWGIQWRYEQWTPPDIKAGKITDIDRLQQLINSHPDAKGILIFPPSIDWNMPLFQRPQQMALAFARLGYLVLYLLREDSFDGAPGIQKITQNLYLGKFPLAALGILEHPVVCVYSYNIDTLSYFNAPRVIYEQLDELDVFVNFPLDRLKKNHAIMVQTADVVVGTADRLVEQLRNDRTDVVLAPNGVDFHYFARPEAELHIPDDVKSFFGTGRPIVGYYGALAEWLDYDLIDYAARQLPEFTFLLVGPDLNEYVAPNLSFKQTAYNTLPSNVHWLGPKQYQELPHYLHSFDVATIPFIVNNVTHAVSPLKLFEYMAGGKPVVTTDLEECKKYAGVIAAQNYDDYVQKLQYALTLRDDPDYRSQLHNTALDNTWEARAATIVDALQEAQTHPRLPVYGLQLPSAESQVKTDASDSPFMKLAGDIGEKVTLLKQEHYLRFYDQLFRSMQNLPLNILEVGVYKGGSLLMFGQYFRNARILGVDLNPPESIVYSEIENSDLRNRVAVALGSQEDIEFLRTSIAQHFVNQPLDIVIDDASHMYQQSRITFDYVFDHQLKSGGLYIIEDWGAGYWPNWPDGNPDGMHGLPRLIKELVDDVAMRDRTLLFEGKRALPVEQELESRIKRITVHPSIVVIEKA
ncbi:MAG: polysaccharide pyruvyl transferase CsaB [Pleurocapsa minor GSE-CHR-MK-17-07R]|nr:polysaccharide pyruvyl transferase CsaB [Pleurocapsa minor GSE-CHR-MK 17-07R]